jgi:hypothetical protein
LLEKLDNEFTLRLLEGFLLGFEQGEFGGWLVGEFVG